MQPIFLLLFWNVCFNNVTFLGDLKLQKELYDSMYDFRNLSHCTAVFVFVISSELRFYIYKTLSTIYDFMKCFVCTIYVLVACIRLWYKMYYSLWTTVKNIWKPLSKSVPFMAFSASFEAGSGHMTQFWAKRGNVWRKGIGERRRQLLLSW